MMGSISQKKLGDKSSKFNRPAGALSVTKSNNVKAVNETQSTDSNHQNHQLDSNSFLIHKLAPEGRDSAPFMLVPT